MCDCEQMPTDVGNRRCCSFNMCHNKMQQDNIKCINVSHNMKVPGELPQKSCSETFIS